MLARSTLLAVCVTGSVALHLGLGMQWSETALATSARPPAVTAQPPRLQRIMVVTYTPSTARDTQAPAHPPVRTVTGNTAPQRPDFDTAAMPDLDTLPPTSAGVPQDAADTAADSDYLPRDRLTRGPMPQQSIDLVYPDLAPFGQFRTVITLFIDDQGVVQRVRFDEADATGLPPILEEATRQTFLRSPFTPGEIDGQPIRSRVRIEVAYTAETPTATR
jgi:hypothetical protein